MRTDAQTTSWIGAVALGLCVMLPSVGLAQNPMTELRAGVKARSEGNWGEALAHFEAAHTASPTWSMAALELAGALLHTGGPAERVGQLLEQVRVTDPDNARLHYLTGLLREEQRLPRQAAASYEQALIHRPSLLDARRRLGRLLVEEGLAKEAIEHLEYVLEKEPESLAAAASLSEAYEKAGRPDDAEKLLRDIIRRFPENPYHLHRLARFFDRHDRPGDAEEARKAADAIRPAREARKLRPLPKSRR